MPEEGAMGGAVQISPRVRGVLFDAVGTLIYADPQVHIAYSEIARDFGLAIDPATVKRRFANACASFAAPDAGGSEVTGEDRERQRWHDIVATVFPNCDSIDELFVRLWDHFARPASWRLFGDVTDCWERLSSRGLSLGIASNFDRRLNGTLSSLPPLDRCRNVFVSSQVGWRKPASQFFRAVEQAMALAPAEMLLVGDDWVSDYLGATAAGWQAAFLDRTGNGKKRTAIRSLAELTSTGVD